MVANGSEKNLRTLRIAINALLGPMIIIIIADCYRFGRDPENGPAIIMLFYSSQTSYLQLTEAITATTKLPQIGSADHTSTVNVFQGSPNAKYHCYCSCMYMSTKNEAFCKSTN